ncbi:hypothetical protein BYT27DRAFT_6342415 [Phlegmacium glaucopus]|nr:hypothetical protein BYT27DRAFT_6342415 [Phlegmacium glaucopus]
MEELSSPYLAQTFSSFSLALHREASTSPMHDSILCNRGLRLSYVRFWFCTRFTGGFRTSTHFRLRINDVRSTFYEENSVIPPLVLYPVKLGIILINCKQLVVFPTLCCRHLSVQIKFPPTLIMHIGVSGPMHYAICIMHPISLRPAVVPTPDLCINRFMHHDVMHYENFYCIPW